MKKMLTEEMIEDLSKMGDVEFSKKWNISRRLIIKRRKELEIRPFNNQHGLREHKIENGIEYKYCPNDGGHWEDVKLFRVSNTRHDGLAGICKKHSIDAERKRYQEQNGKEKAQKYRKTDSGKKSLRNVWRKQTAIKKDAYVLWKPEHEQRAYKAFGGCCAYCGIEVPFLKIEFDHFIPITKGGKTEPSNMVPCCTLCNHGAGGKFNKDPWKWISTRFHPEFASDIYTNCIKKLQELSQNI
jgi:5-methylcytosine-specific restriction endonuclease McrA